MKNLYSISLFFLLIFFTNSKIVAQINQEYLGVLKLNDSSFISYKVNLTEKNSVINGFSVTDIGGKHETKSLLIGTYDKKKNLLKFNETTIVYTKSEITTYDFCHVHFSGKVKNINSKKNIEGKFEGKYSDGTSCINGELALKNISKIIKKAAKIDRVIQRTKRIPEEEKVNISITKQLDSLKMNVLRSNNNLSMFSTSPFITLHIYDAGKEDGDRISILVNEQVILKNYTISKKVKKIKIPLLSRQTKIKVRALNSGNISPNTVKVEFIDKSNKIEAIVSLNKFEKTEITVINRNIDEVF